MKKSKFYLPIFVTTISLLSIMFITCRKEVDSDRISSSTNRRAYAYAVSQDEAATVLDDWWANYAVFKNIDYSNSITPNLDAPICESDAITMLHYSMNVAMTHVDSTWEDVTYDSVFYAYDPGDDNPITKRDVCTAFDNIRSLIKQKLTATEIVENAINNITIFDNSISSNKINVKVEFRATGGKLIATRDILSEPNSSMTIFPSGTSIPWAARQSSTGTFTTDPFFNYWFFLFNGKEASSNNEKYDGYNMLPIDKPAHIYLSSAQLFWPDPPSALAGYTPYLPFGYTYVQSPDLLQGNIPTYIQMNNDPIMPTSYPNYLGDHLGPQEVTTCNNPHKTDFGLPGEMEASYILSYAATENTFGFTTTRRLNASDMDFFWSGRPYVAAAGFTNNVSNMSYKFATYPQLNGGLYAVTGLVYKVHTWQSIQACTTPFNCQSGSFSVCDHRANYVVDCRFSHFTIQHMTPSQFASILA